MTGVKLFTGIKYFPLLVIIISFFSIPYFYSQRLATGIFKTDFYLIWFAGCSCWIHNLLFFSISVNRLALVSLTGCAYVFLLCLFNSFPDENSIYAFTTLVCCVGIIYYLNVVWNSKYYISVTVTIFLVYFFQVYIGYSQAMENNWESLSIKGLLYNSGFFGNFLVSMLPILLSGFFNKASFNLFTRTIFSVAFICSAVLLGFTFARSAYIGATIGCLFVLVYHSKRIKVKRTLAVWVVGALILIVVMVIGLFKLKPASALGRLTIYKISINIIKDHPLTGVGPNRFSAVYNNYQSAYFKSEQAPVQTQLLADNTLEAFNSILQILVEYGIIGFMILIWFFYELIKGQASYSEIKDRKWLRIGSLASIIAVFLCSLFSNPFHVTPILLILVYHVSNVLQTQKKMISFPNRQTFVRLFVGIPLVFLLSSYIIIQIKGESAWQKASELAKYNSFKIAKRLYEEAYPVMRFNGDFLFNYGAEGSVAGDYNLAIRVLEEAKKYNSFSNLFLFLGDAYLGTNEFALAEKNYLHAIFIAPSHMYPKYQLIQLYKQWGKQELAKAWTVATLQYPVKVKSPTIDGLINELKESVRN